MRTWSKLGLVCFTVAAGAVVGCSGSDGAQGPKGDPGATGPAGSGSGTGTTTPSVSGVTPSRSFLARTAEVTISGFGSTWSSSTTADFGAGITVKKLTVASPTALLATVDISKTAAIGPRDVTINDGGNKEVYKGAFHVDAPIALSTLGTIAQGSVFVVTAKQLDVSTPFDATQTGDGLFTPISFPNLAATASSGVNGQVSSATPFNADFTVLVDVTAPAAASDFSVLSGPQGAEIESPAPKSLNVAARTATALTSGTAATGNVAKPFDSVLYTLVPGANTSIIDFTAASAVTGASPKVVLLPKSGKFADSLGFVKTSTLVTTSADPLYAIYWDATGTTGAFTVTGVSTTATALAGNTTAITAATAQIATALPLVMTGGSLSSATDQHWVKYTAVAGDVGKKFHVQTVPGDRKTDTVVDVFASNGTTSLGGPSADTGYHENFVSTAIPSAGVYYIQVSYSTAGAYDATNKAYQLIVRLQ